MKRFYALLLLASSVVSGCAQRSAVPDAPVNHPALAATVATATGQPVPILYDKQNCALPNGSVVPCSGLSNVYVPPSAPPSAQ